MLTLLSILVPLAVGGTVVWFSRRYPRIVGGVTCEMTRTEVVICGVAILVVSVLVTMFWGPSAARAQAASGYREFWNGSLVDAEARTKQCTRDGSCQHEYRCDPYNHVHTETYTDSKGNTQTRTENHTHYHRCPYATQETDYVLLDSLGRTLTIGAAHLDAQPTPWRGSKGIPGDLPRGVPERWTIAREHLLAGVADPVTKVNTYTNYILPTEGELYKQFSASIEKYREAQLLPDHTAKLYDDPMFDFEMQARKVMPVGGVAVDIDAWHARLMQFNAALGMERQGDLHLVLAPAEAIDNPDDYVNAVVAHWQRGLGRWGFPKNGIAVVLGIGDGRIRWARAKTGMPTGNGEMATAVSFQLERKRAEPDVVLGNVVGRPAGDDVTYDLGDGVLADIMFTDHPFQRACMNCDDAEDKGTGFVYLKDSLPISTGAKVLMFFIVLAISCGLWAGAYYCDPIGYCTGRRREQPRSSRTYY